MYKYNPKTADSGVVCCIPQKTKCKIGCSDCFFNSGRSYLEPLEENLPNMPTLEQVGNNIVRVNDGNDSNVDRAHVVESTKIYKKKFYNTSIPKDISGFDAPVVLTLNPAGMTDTCFHTLPVIPNNLMAARFRTNMWNQTMLGKVVQQYSNVPILITLMAYHDQNYIPEEHRKFYEYRKRTLNPYWCVTKGGLDNILSPYRNNKHVLMCGNPNTYPEKSSCKYCCNCKTLYYIAKIHGGTCLYCFGTGQDDYGKCPVCGGTGKTKG